MIDELEQEKTSHDLLLEACRAAIAYDKAIQDCENQPEGFVSSCVVVSDKLDDLYSDWIAKAVAAIALTEREAAH